MDKILELVNNLPRAGQVDSLSEYCRKQTETPVYKQLNMVVSNSSFGLKHLREVITYLIDLDESVALTNNTDQKLVLCLLLLADYDKPTLSWATQALHGTNHFWASCVSKSLVLSQYVKEEAPKV